MSHIRDEVTDAYLLKMVELIAQAMQKAEETAEGERREPGAVLESSRSTQSGAS